MRQCDLAAAAGISVRELMKLERGLIIPSEKLLRQISNCLGVDVDQITVAQNRLFENPSTGEGYVTACPESTQTIQRRKSLDCTKRPVIDLFCGVGGLSYGFEMHEEFQVVAGVDLLNDRVQTFSNNHGASIAAAILIRT